VGLLVAGIDQDGPHLFETCPSGNYYEYKAYSIGARSQSARTYLEDHLAEFPTSTLDELIFHSLSALKKSASDEGEVKPNSVEIAFVGKNRHFTILKEAEIGSYLDRLKDFKGSAEKMEIEGSA
jgi:20S proteasome subunit alpha 6